VKHAKDDPERFREWVAEYYRDHAERIDRALQPLFDALHTRMSDRIAVVEELLKQNIRALLDGDPVEVVARWEDGELCERYIRTLKGLTQ
jgi:hypothetical protein